MNEMPRNVTHWVPAVDPVTGKPYMMPIPFQCECGQPSCYGLGGKWYCSECWIAKAPSRLLIDVVASVS